MTDGLTDKEVAKLKRALKTPSRRRKKMTTSKRAFWMAFMLSILLVLFAAAMILLDKDTSTVSIFGGAGVACIPIIFGIYEKHSNDISLKHMEMNYDPNYDEEHGLK